MKLTRKRSISTFMKWFKKYYKLIFILVFALTGLNLKVLFASPLPGQIIVDSSNPAWLKYNGGGPFFMCGPGDPEGFLYLGSRNYDGTRTGDQMGRIDRLKGTGANSIYLMAVRSHGGDGDGSQNPFIDSNPANGLNQNILDQWEIWFSEMDQNGIVIFFIFYDDSARIWSGNNVGPEEKAFIKGIVDRFEHHKNLIWCVAEEYQESYSANRVKNIAAEIKAADDYDHVIAVHKLNGLDFSEFADDPNIDQFAIQYNSTNHTSLHNGMISAWNNAAGRYNLNMAEATSYGTGETARKKNWAIAMGGAYIMALGWDIANTPLNTLEDCGRLVSFMQSTNFNEMLPHDELKFESTEYVLADPGDSYIAYTSAYSGAIGLKSLTSGKYNFKWFDVSNGYSVSQDALFIGNGDLSMPKPTGIGNELAVYIKRVGDIGGIPPEPPTGLEVINPKL